MHHMSQKFAVVLKIHKKGRNFDKKVLFVKIGF